MKIPIAIQYLENRDIDKFKWDLCIDGADNGLVYAYSYYLDHMSKHWAALVLNDYEAVMPLTWNKKYGINYLYQPFLCASLGVFGKDKDLDGRTTEAFLLSIPKKFRYWDIYLNHGNLFPLKDFNLYVRLNHVLALNKNYDELYRHFRASYKQTLKRAERTGCTLHKNIAIEKVIAMAKSKLDPIARINEKEYDHFIQLYKLLGSNNNAINYGIYSPREELLASGVFLFSHQRAYYILAGNHPNGRTLGASHQVVNAFIKDYAGSNLLLDFEGSDLSNIAFFQELWRC